MRIDTSSFLKYYIIYWPFFVMNVIGFAWYCSHMRDLHYLIKYFSIQSFELAIAYSMVALIKIKRESRMAQILYELSFTSNIIACLGYWIVVRPHSIDIISTEFTFCNDYTHTMPILMLIVIYCVEKPKYFQQKNLRYQGYLFIMTTLINIFYTFWDRPVYKFINYRKAETAIYLIGCFMLLILIFLGMSKLTESRTKNLKLQ